MEVSLEFDFSGWQTMIASIRANCTPEKLMAGAGDIMRKDIAAQFDEQGDPHWDALSPMRVQQRLASYPFDDLTILIETERLMNSWTQPGGEHFEIVTDDSFTVGSTVFYAALQQYGGINDAGFEVPARPVVIREIMLDEIAEQVVVNLTGES